MKEEEGKKSIEKVRKKKDEIDEHEGEKRSLLALWQLQRVPRRITRALDATDCQQDPPRRSLNGDAQHELTHTHTHHTHLRGRHPAICFTCFLSSCSTSVLSLSLPLLFFPPRTPPPFFFSLSLFLSLFFSHRAAARGEERPQTGSICSIFRALLRPHAHGRRMSRRRNDPTSLYSLYSLTHFML